MATPPAVHYEMLPGFPAPSVVYDVCVDGKVVDAIADMQGAYQRERCLIAEMEATATDDVERAAATWRVQVRSRAVVGDALAFFALPSKMEEMERQFAALAKRAAKNGRPAPSWRQVGTRIREVRERDVLGYTRDYTETRAIITVETADVTLQGWRFVATLERMGTANLVRVSPKAQADGVVVPVEYRSRFTCDHCRTKRNRNATYLFAHEDGRWMQTGTNCAKEVFGADCGAEVAYWASYADAVRGGGWDEDGEGFGSGERCPTTTGLFPFLLTVAIHVKAYGWTSRGAAKAHAGLSATADLAWASLTMPPSKSAIEAAADLRQALDKRGVTQQELGEALAVDVKNAIAWAKGLEPRGSDYEHNLKAAIGVDFVKASTAGIVASAYPGYLRAQEREVERKQRAADRLNEYVAPVGTKFGGKAKGNRSPLPVTVVFMRDFSNDWGVKTLVMMRDADGRTAKWWASGGIELRVGGSYLLAGSVKQCVEYKGVKETTFTRCTLAETEESKVVAAAEAAVVKATAERRAAEAVIATA